MRIRLSSSSSHFWRTKRIEKVGNLGTILCAPSGVSADRNTSIGLVYNNYEPVNHTTDEIAISNNLMQLRLLRTMNMDTTAGKIICNC